MAKQNIFSSLEECTEFKKKLNHFKISNVGFADINAHYIDSFSVNQHREGTGFKYAVSKFAWVASKLFRKKIEQSKANILFVPIEPGKDRSMGLYTPIINCLQPDQYQLIGIEQLFNKVDIKVFLRWIFSIPAILHKVNKVFKTKEAAVLKNMKNRLAIDTVIHSLWIMQLRHFFTSAGYKSLLVDWDRHSLQSLIVQAAKMEGVQTYTFVHGAIYTPEKFVPLIADKCLVWGNRHVDFFTGLGERFDRLIKVGNTRFRKELPNRQAVFKKYNIDNSKKIILHPSQNFPDLEDHVIVKELHQYISANENFRLAIKVHPSQNNNKLLREISGLDNLILLDKNISASEALSIADFSIIVSSTFAIDAMIAGVPVAIYKQPGSALRGIAVELVENANVPFLQTENDFSKLLNIAAVKPADECFDMQAQHKFTNDYCEYYGDESAKLIARLLVK